MRLSILTDVTAEFIKYLRYTHLNPGDSLLNSPHDFVCIGISFTSGACATQYKDQSSTLTQQGGEQLGVIVLFNPGT